MHPVSDGLKGEGVFSKKWVFMLYLAISLVSSHSKAP